MGDSAATASVARGEHGASRWEMATRRPHPILEPYIREYQGYTEISPGPLRRRELPAPYVVIIIELGPPIGVFADGEARAPSRYPSGFTAGLSDRLTITEHGGFQRGVQLILTPIGARHLFGLPMSELTGNVIALGDLWPEHGKLAEILAELPGWDERFDTLERILCDRMTRSEVQTDIVSWACERIVERGGALDMRALARELGYSQKHVIRMFRDQVGVPPKMLARIVRFDRLIQRIRSGAPVRWARLAQELGYYDQSHLARDTRQFAGVKPTDIWTLLSDFGQ